MKEIKIENLAIYIHLGVTDLERSIPQKTLFDVHYFYVPSQGSSDEIQNLICYDSLAVSIESFVAEKHFKTVEYLAEEVYLHIRKFSVLITDLNLVVKKLHPPMSNNISVDAVVVKIGSK
jgi:FolB domain-containing protein